MTLIKNFINIIFYENQYNQKKKRKVYNFTVKLEQRIIQTQKNMYKTELS